MNVKTRTTDLEGVLLLQPEAWLDERGALVEQYRRDVYGPLGIAPFAQINHARSGRGVLRGLHFQELHPQAKLVWTVAGAVWNVAVDVRRGSPTFGRWTAAVLSGDDRQQMWIPAGLAHGFCVLGDSADCLWTCSDFHAEDARWTIAWNDPDLAIEWPIASPLVSVRDAAAPRLRDAPVLPAYSG